MALSSSLPPAFLDAFSFFTGKMRRTGSTGGVGLYYDKYTLQTNSASGGPISIGSTGFGMVSVCIGCALGLTSRSEAIQLTLETLESLLGEREGFTPKRSNRTKFFTHFLDPETGDAASSTSEISTIDTALMAAGAMFARNYLKDPTVSQKTNSLVQGIDWGAAVGGDEYLCMVMDPDTGAPDWTKKTKPFNEYYILAYIGKVVEGEMMKSGGPATTYFDKYYGNPPQSLKDAGAAYKSYWGYNVWSDSDSHFASSFEVQFCFYLSKFFQTNPVYQQFFTQSAAADWKYFRNIFQNPAYSKVVTKYSPYQWGCGAGEYPGHGGYFATAIENDDQLVYSAPIIAGFFPADDAVSRLEPQSYVRIEEALEQLYTNEVCTCNVDGKKVLWRRSLLQTDWVPGAIQSVDYSTFLLGYAWKLAGADFFSANAI